MNPDTATPPPPMHTSSSPNHILRDLDLGSRVGFLMLTLLLGYCAVRLSWSFSAGTVHAMFSGMLKGTPFPFTVQLVHAINPALIALSVALPITATVAAFAVRRPLTALLIIAGCNLILALISILVGTAIMDTFAKIVSALG